MHINRIGRKRTGEGSAGKKGGRAGKTEKWRNQRDLVEVYL